jgi:hypothetical protein
MSAAHFHVTPRSANAKTGPIVVTTSAAKTCPPACPLKRTCYAKGGPLALHWAAVSRGDRGAPWARFLADLSDALAKAPRGQIWRHNQAGDLPGAGDRIDREALAALIATNATADARGFTYTHKPLIAADAPKGAKGRALAAANLAAVAESNANGFTINASANNLAHVDALADALDGRAPIVVVVAAAPLLPLRVRHRPRGSLLVLDERRAEEALVLFTPHLLLTIIVDLTLFSLICSTHIKAPLLWLLHLDTLAQS